MQCGSAPSSFISSKVKGQTLKMAASSCLPSQVAAVAECHPDFQPCSTQSHRENLPGVIQRQRISQGDCEGTRGINTAREPQARRRVQLAAVDSSGRVASEHFSKPPKWHPGRHVHHLEYNSLKEKTSPASSAMAALAWSLIGEKALRIPFSCSKLLLQETSDNILFFFFF